MPRIWSARCWPATLAVCLPAVLLGTGGCTFYSAARVPNRNVWAVAGPDTAPLHPPDKPMSLRLESGRLEFNEDGPVAVRFSDGQVVTLGTQQIPAQALREIGSAPTNYATAFGGGIVVTTLLGTALDRLPPTLADVIQSSDGPHHDQAARLAREILADEPLVIRGQLGAWIVGGWFALKPEERSRLNRALDGAMNPPPATRPGQSAPTSQPG